LTATLRLGVVPTAAAAVPAVAGPLLDAHPGVRVETRTCSNEQMVAAIDARTLDAGVAYVDDVTGGLPTVPLYRERLVLLTPAALPGRPGGPVPWARTADLDLCLLAPEMLQRRIVDAALRTAGVEAAPRIETDSIPALLDLVAAGWSTVVGHPWIADRPLPAGVVARPLERPVVARPVGLLLPRGPVLAPAVRALRATLAEVDVQARVGPLP
ncbi:LysR family transcriptional regulator substrate-binding protein, partial [Patulibacter sp. S7RM1-6]